MSVAVKLNRGVELVTAPLNGEFRVTTGAFVSVGRLVIPIAFFLAAYRVAEKLVELYKTDAQNIKLFSEHEAIIEEIKGENK